MTDQTSRAIGVLTEGEPMYDDLRDLYEELQTAPAETPYERVTQRALCQIVGEFIEYLDFIGQELEKEVGLPRSAERERILHTIDDPQGDDPVECTSHIIEQWEDIDFYTRDDITFVVERDSTTEERPSHRSANFEF